MFLTLSADARIATINVVRQSLSRTIAPWEVKGPLTLATGMDRAVNDLPTPGVKQVVLAVAAEARELRDGEPATVFRAEVQLEAIVSVGELPEHEQEIVLSRITPARLYAHARQYIESLTRDSGFRPVTLPPAELDISQALQSAGVTQQ